MGRAMDDAIIAAAIGSSDTGVAGGTAVAWSWNCWFNYR
jgi:hypothetical protein